MPRLVFPVAGGVKSWKPNFGAARDGGRRSHRGQDLMAPRMTPVLACFSGTVFTSKGGNAGNWATILGDCGWSANYMHLNDDKTDLDDDGATRDLTYAPWIQDGGHVQEGDLIGFVGNSGNAKTSGHHLHFELIGPEGEAVDPASFLRQARIEESPSVTVPPLTYTAPVFTERIVERPLPMTLAPLRLYRDQALLRFGKPGRPVANVEHLVRIDHRDMATTGKSEITYTWDTNREADGEHLIEFVKRNFVDRSEIVLETKVVLVANGPIPERPEVGGPNLDLLMGLNYYRKLSGLPYLTWDERLGRAAESHTDYWEINKSNVRHSPHNEQRGHSGFSGEMPSDRARANGYPLGTAECMHFIGRRDAIDALWAVPYHRFALANGAGAHVGIGSSGQTVTVDIGMGPGEGVVVFPPDGMTGVPLNGNVNESPAPLRMHRGQSGQAGYVITYAVYAPFPQRLQVTKAELREAGRVVDCISTPRKTTRRCRPVQS
ncbi:MAG: peptidoglycan DD-metalloendopeptidase family protein [Armatimonadota bacterium]|nr:peptidoglycan DD-metalloendopeptidase family protein [Armatimonadota bacterium]